LVGEEKGVRRGCEGVVVSFARYRRAKKRVIPAKAGIYCVNLRKRAAYALDSRFRGNDA